MNIILDTNVLVAGLLTPFGPCGEIVRMVSSGELTLSLDARILIEFQEVLDKKIRSRSRPDFLQGIQMSAKAAPAQASP